MKKISVFLVDDSALVRQLTAELLSREPDIQICGTAPDPVAALQRIKSCQPDVILLDVEMPRMDGLELLDILSGNPETSNIPVVMFSSLTEKGCNITLKALERGAVDFVTKPKFDLRRGFDGLIHDLLYRIRGAAQSKKPNEAVSVQNGPQQFRADAPTPAKASNVALIAIGSSTGGTEALRHLLKDLPTDLPPVVIVQHMHERFTGPFAQRLNQITAITVKEASDGEKLERGHAYLAPGSHHLEIHKIGGNLRIRLLHTDPVNGHRPSVDVLFHSCAKTCGAHTVAAILTGMGNDGAKGLLALRKAGAYTIAQNEASCVVFGMPKEAIAMGAAAYVLPLGGIASQIQSFTSRY